MNLELTTFCLFLFSLQHFSFAETVEKYENLYRKRESWNKFCSDTKKCRNPQALCAYKRRGGTLNRVCRCPNTLNCENNKFNLPAEAGQKISIGGNEIDVETKNNIASICKASKFQCKYNRQVKFILYNDKEPQDISENHNFFCENDFCNDHGICYYHNNDEKTKFCACDVNFKGATCMDSVNEEDADKLDGASALGGADDEEDEDNAYIRITKLLYLTTSDRTFNIILIVLMICGIISLLAFIIHISFCAGKKY